MKLLLDENLSYRLLPAIDGEYPGSSHVALRALGSSDDLTVWRHARDHGFVLVTKDDDFLHLAAVHGAPPVIVRLTLGNCRNERIVQALLAHAAAIREVMAGGTIAVIEVC